VNAPVQTPPAPEKIDFAKRVQQFVKLRDLIADKEAAAKAELKPYKETLEQLNAVLLQHLNEVNGDSIQTPHGTVYRTAKKSASVADMTAFWTYVVSQGDWDLIDKKANVTAVADHVEKHQTPPPGVNYSVTHVVGVRRK